MDNSLRFEYVIWQDIVCDSGWTGPDGLTGLATIHSAGVYVDEDDTMLRLAVAYGDDEVEGLNPEWTGVLAIPKGCILQRKVLEVR